MFVVAHVRTDCDNMTLHFCLLSQGEDDLQDHAAYQPQLGLWLVYNYTLLHFSVVSSLYSSKG